MAGSQPTSARACNERQMSVHSKEVFMAARVGPAARTNKGHPKRVARRVRAAERLAEHVYNPDRCKPGCPKRPK